MAKIIETATGALALTFDDVLLQPGHSEVMPGETDVSTRIAGDIELNVPILSAAMDTVTESRLAIAMAQAGGIGVIHRNFTPAEQAEQVRQVKKFESGMVVNPVTIGPDATLADARALMRTYGISGIPVVENGGTGGQKTGRLVGILTNRDVRFASDPSQKVYELMTQGKPDHRERERRPGRGQAPAAPAPHRKAAGGRQGRQLRRPDHRQGHREVAAQPAMPPRTRRAGCAWPRRPVSATTVSSAPRRLIDAGVDLLVIDTAHGHSQRVLDAVTRAKKLSNFVRIMAGNVATADGTQALIDAGADAVKVGIGPGSICTTRIVAGVGVPQLSAIMSAVETAQRSGVSVIADGGIKYSGDLAKALAAGASAAMIGSLLAGTDESPGEVYLHQGRSFKAYRGMGSVGAMARGSADRYFQAEVRDTLKLVPEGIEGQVPYKGPVSGVLHQLAGGLKAAMGYVGARNLAELARARHLRAHIQCRPARKPPARRDDHPRKPELFRRPLGPAANARGGVDEPDRDLLADVGARAAGLYRLCGGGETQVRRDPLGRGQGQPVQGPGHEPDRQRHCRQQPHEPVRAAGALPRAMPGAVCDQRCQLPDPGPDVDLRRHPATSTPGCILPATS